MPGADERVSIKISKQLARRIADLAAAEQRNVEAYLALVIERDNEPLWYIAQSYAKPETQKDETHAADVSRRLAALRSTMEADMKTVRLERCKTDEHGAPATPSRSVLDGLYPPAEFEQVESYHGAHLYLWQIDDARSRQAEVIGHIGQNTWIALKRRPIERRHEHEQECSTG
jgi:hypothetical protein